MEAEEQEAHIYSASDSQATIGSIAGDVLGSLSVVEDAKKEKESSKEEKDKE